MLKFKPLAVEYADVMTKWRTDPGISAHMFTEPKTISKNDQVAWINARLTDDSFLGFIICDCGEPVGFLSYTKIDRKNRHCSTGSYIVDRSASAKYAVTLHEYIYTYAFEVLKMNKVYAEVLETNKKVLKLQELLGMQLAGILRQHVLKSNEWLDIYIYEQLSTKWHERRFRTRPNQELFNGFM